MRPRKLSVCSCPRCALGAVRLKFLSRHHFRKVMKLLVPSTSAHRLGRAYNLLAALATIFATPAVPALALPAPVVFHVSLGQASVTPVSGRLLVFAKLLGPADKRPVA